ncbi:fucose permease [Deinococcus sp. HSC-46F16]|uniref:MFS transporter n=1 Tax=Deinococcus sp. HSC-46F16 TaxID=2910968 RepID=UPI00209F09F9|nr:MFS transporter [Deinococcus sp. HSC-46F16]MCP2014579.1 fucose permease [Deinococcus sp. HSC-46F16]
MTPPSPAASRRPLLASLAFLAFVSLGLPDGLLGVSWPSMRGDLGVPLDALGLLAAVQTAGYLTSSFLSGRVLRVQPIGTVLALSTLAAAVALLGFALTPAWPLLLAFGFLAGLGGGAVDAGLNAYGARHFSARTLNWLHAFFGLGTTLGPLIVTAVLGSGNVWRWSYVIVGGAQLALALTFFLTRRRWVTATAPDGESAAPVPAARTRETLRRPVVWLGMLTFFLYTGVEAVTAQWSYSLLTLGRGVPETAAGLFVSLYWGSLMVGRILFGAVANRVPLVGTLRLCLIASVAGALLFWLEPTRALSVAGLMMIGFFLAPIFASLISLTPGRVGQAHADSAIGFQVAAAGLGGAALTALVGVLSRWGGLELIGASVTVLAALLLALYEVFMRVGGGETAPERVGG